MLNTKIKKLLSLILAVGLVLTMGAVAIADDMAPDCTLYETMEYLVDYIGQRVYGTPNEKMAAEYVKGRFESFGYTDVELLTLNRSASYIGRLAFTDGSGDIYGNMLPNNDTFPLVDGKLVDLGTFPDLAIPEGTVGKIVGAVRFNGAPNATNLNPVLAELAVANEGVEIVGVLLANATTYTVATVTGTPSVPCITTAGYFLERAVAKAGAFSYMERYARTADYSVLAKKPAPSGDPDMIIVVSSHIDSVLASPGASDNGSSVAANIELARRLKDVDMGNIEVWFAAVAAEEGGGMTGSVYIANLLNNSGLGTRSINMNMDMVCSPTTTSGGVPLNAVSMDINTAQFNATGFNLPAYLVTDEAKSIPWAAGIDNVRIFRYGSSDHTQFATRGIEAASMIVVTNATDDIELQDHNSRDNLQENYSYERHLMCTNLMENGILKAARQEVSKRAFIDVYANSGIVSLVNAEQLFKTYYEVTGTFTGAGGNVPFKFTADNPTVSLANPQDYAITGLTARGTGNADNWDAARNEQYKIFTAALAGQVSIYPDAEVSIAGPAIVANGPGSTAEYTISVKNMPAVSGIELEFEIDGTFLGAKAVTPIGYTIFGDGNFGSDIYWRNEGNIWFGKITLINADGVSGDVDILKLVFDLKTGVLGDTAVSISYALLSYAGFSIPADITNGVVNTSLVKYFVPYDLNKDGVVDLNDVTWALQYFMVKDGDPEWDIAKAADFSGNNQIDVDDLLLILANYSNPYYV